MLEKYYNITNKISENGKDLGLLFLRLVLAHGFYGPAMMKLKSFKNTVGFFDGIGIPAPEINAVLATVTETLGFVLLFLGLGVRIITFPLMITMLVAIFFVHWKNGYDVGNNGIEIPLYYLLMLFVLFTQGGGKFSVDFFLRKRLKK
jgi:putative oxidoreductase